MTSTYNVSNMLIIISSVASLVLLCKHTSESPTLYKYHEDVVIDFYYIVNQVVLLSKQICFVIF